jgi:transcriptional regulator with XRE-family HTH domain
MIRAWRERMGFTQEQAAEALGCSRRSLTSWENGESQAARYIGLAMAALALGMKPYFESAAASNGGEE